MCVFERDFGDGRIGTAHQRSLLSNQDGIVKDGQDAVGLLLPFEANAKLGLEDQSPRGHKERDITLELFLKFEQGNRVFRVFDDIIHFVCDARYQIESTFKRRHIWVVWRGVTNEIAQQKSVTRDSLDGLDEVREDIEIVGIVDDHCATAEMEFLESRGICFKVFDPRDSVWIIFRVDLVELEEGTQLKESAP